MLKKINPYLIANLLPALLIFYSIYKSSITYIVMLHYKIVSAKMSFPSETQILFFILGFSFLLEIIFIVSSLLIPKSNTAKQYALLLLHSLSAIVMENMILSSLFINLSKIVTAL